MTLTTEQVEQVAKTIAENYRNNPAALSNLVKSHLRFDMTDIISWPNDIDTASLHLTLWFNHPEFIAPFLRALKEICPSIAGIDELIRQATFGQQEESAGRLEVMLDDIKEELPETHPFLKKVAVISRQICRITAPYLKSPNQWCTGTGFLVGPDLVLTNYHVLEDVIKDQRLASKVVFEFDYGDDTKQSPKIHMAAKDPLMDYSPYAPQENQRIPLDAQSPLDPNQLDYALVRLERAIGTETDGSSPPRLWVKIPAPSSLPLIRRQMYLMIMQHPEGKSLRHDQARDAVDHLQGYGLVHHGLRVRYKVNTQKGSSGSPCFDREYNLVALHHTGNREGKTADLIKFNQGIPIDKIRDRLKNTINWTQPEPPEIENPNHFETSNSATTDKEKSVMTDQERRMLIGDLNRLTMTDLRYFITQNYGPNYEPANAPEKREVVTLLIQWVDSQEELTLSRVRSDLTAFRTKKH